MKTVFFPKAILNSATSHAENFQKDACRMNGESFVIKKRGICFGVGFSVVLTVT